MASTILFEEYALKDKKQETINILCFSLGDFISILGSSLYTFAFSLYVLKLTGSALNFATTLTLGIVPTILINPFAGAIADRINQKKIVIIMNLLCAVLFLGLYAISYKASITLMMIYVTTFLVTIFTSFMGIAFEAAKPGLVFEENLVKINSLSRIISSSSQIVGPIVGGVIFMVLPIQLFVLINSLSFVLAAFLTLFIQFNLTRLEKCESSLNIKNDILEGVRYIWQHERIKWLYTWFVALNFFLGFSVMVPLPYIINTILRLRPANYGVIEGAMCVGVIIGALIILPIQKRIAYEILIPKVSKILAITMILMGVPSMLGHDKLSELGVTIYYISLMFVLGVTLSCVDIPIFSILQKEIPSQLLGRVLSIGISYVKMVLPLAFVLAGGLLSTPMGEALPMIGGALYLFTLFLMNKKLVCY